MPLNEDEHLQQRHREKQLEPNEDEDIEDIEEENIEIERPSGQGINNNCTQFTIISLIFNSIYVPQTESQESQDEDKKNDKQNDGNESERSKSRSRSRTRSKSGTPNSSRSGECNSE